MQWSDLGKLCSSNMHSVRAFIRGEWGRCSRLVAENDFFGWQIFAKYSVSETDVEATLSDALFDAESKYCFGISLGAFVREIG